MSKLILGTANFSQSYGLKNGKQIKEDEIKRILQTAIDNGINQLDTSTIYNSAESKPVKIIKTIKKVEDYWHYSSIKELSHGIDRINDRQWDGVSVDTPEEALKVTKMKMRIIQFPYNVFDHSIADTNFFKLTEKYKITTIARSIFLQGLLLMDNPPIGREYIKKLDNIIKPYGLSRKEAVFLFAYRNAGIDYVIVGIDNAEQLLELISMTKYYLPDSLFDELLDIDDIPEEIKYPWRWKL